jgi:hypothetical protein
VIERAVLLRQENDVIERGNVLSGVKRCRDLLARIERQCAGCVVAAAASCPSGEI